MLGRKIVDATEMADLLEGEAAYLSKWVNDNEDIVDTLPIEYAIQTVYEAVQFIREGVRIQAEAAMALLLDEIGD